VSAAIEKRPFAANRESVIRCLWPLNLPADGRTKRTIQSMVARRIPGLRLSHSVSGAGSSGLPVRRQTDGSNRS
jgi:hypothetical protein